MRRAGSLITTATRSPRFLSNCSSQLQQRLLLKSNLPSASSHFLFSQAADANGKDAKQEEKSNGNGAKKEEKPITVSLKSGNVRLTSKQFFSAVKKAVGSDVPDEEFVIPREAYDALAAEYDAALEDIASFKDKYTRALAETENVRRRGMKQVEEAKLFTLQKFSKDLIGVRDILDLAVGAVKQENVDANPQLKALYDGIVMTCKVFEKTFANHGIEKVHPVGEKFDPNLHEAVFQVPKEQAKQKPGHIEHVTTIGYSLNGRPIRAAKVAVVAD